MCQGREVCDPADRVPQWGLLPCKVLRYAGHLPRLLCPPPNAHADAPAPGCWYEDGEQLSLTQQRRQLWTTMNTGFSAVKWGEPSTPGGTLRMKRHSPRSTQRLAHAQQTPSNSTAGRLPTPRCAERVMLPNFLGAEPVCLMGLHPVGCGPGERGEV